MRKTINSISIMAILWIAMSFSGNSTEGKLIIHMNHFVGDQPLYLDSSYNNDLGQKFTITNFKYYISNIHLTREDGAEFISNEVFLVNEDEIKSKDLFFDKIPNGSYQKISFTIGIDSLRNCSGAQSGALNPIHGMFWAWNTGYIFLKLEGKSSFSNSPGHIFEYHIGGYKPPASCIRKVEIDLAPHFIKIENKKASSIPIKVNISELFKEPLTIDLSKLSSVTDFHNAETMADNYKDMFSILEK